jgi:pantothenate kinase
MTEPQVVPFTIASLAERVRRIAAGSRRTIVGIAGPPGAGKTAVAQALMHELGTDGVLVPMDGFHLSNAVLESLGRRGRKGAPDTFDAAGYVALLRRLRTPDADVVYAPTFFRDIEEPIGSSVAITPETPVVVTEGNYRPCLGPRHRPTQRRRRLGPPRRPCTAALSTHPAMPAWILGI